MSNEIMGLNINTRYELNELPNTELFIGDKGDGTIAIDLTINRTVLRSDVVPLKSNESIGIHKGIIYAIPDTAIDGDCVDSDDLRALFAIPDNIEEIAYQIFDCKNCIRCGAYSKGFAVEHYSKLLGINPLVLSSMLG